MFKIVKHFTALLLCLIILKSSFAQDSSTAVRNWKVEAKRISEGKYELSFSALVINNWQVYAPNQTLLEVKTTELKFTDSSIVQKGDFIDLGIPKKYPAQFSRTKP